MVLAGGVVSMVYFLGVGLKGLAFVRFHVINKKVVLLFSFSPLPFSSLQIFFYVVHVRKTMERENKKTTFLRCSHGGMTCCATMPFLLPFSRLSWLLLQLEAVNQYIACVLVGFLLFCIFFNYKKICIMISSLFYGVHVLGSTWCGSIS